MYDKFSFDGLHFFNNYISIGSLTIKFYGICIMLGMIAACLVAIKLFKKYELAPDLIVDYMIAIVPICIITARLWYVVNDLDSFKDNFLDVFKIWEGGLAIIGGVMGGALAVFIVCKIKKIPFLYIADIACILLPLGQAIGRWGNFFNMEVYGAESNFNFFPMAVYIGIENYGSWHVPLFLYESILNLILFSLGMVLFYKRKNIQNKGYNMCLYFMGYGLIRFILEPLRDSKFNLMGTTGSNVLTQQLTSGIVILLGILCLVYFLYRDKKLFFKNINEENKNDYRIVFIVLDSIVLLSILLGLLLGLNVFSFSIGNPSVIFIFISSLFGLALVILSIVFKKDKMLLERLIGIVLLFAAISFLLFISKSNLVLSIIVTIILVVALVLYIVFYHAPNMEKEKGEKV